MTAVNFLKLTSVTVKYVVIYIGYLVTTLAYFPNSSALNSQEPLTALLDGARRGGMTPVENSLDADCAVIWSVLWHGRMKANQAVYEHYRQHSRPVICIDVGALNRGHTWKVAVNNITAAGYYHHNENLDWDRPKKLNVLLSKPKSNNNQILIAAQHKNSLQVEKLSSIEDWVTDQVKQVKQYTDRAIVVRPHPRCRLDVNFIPQDVEIQQPVRLTNTYDSFDMTFDYHTVINYNSGPGIQAAITGVPVLVDSTSLAHPVGIDISEIDAPEQKDRYQWFVEICHTEYTVDELRNGLWLKRLKEKLLKV